MTEPPCLPLPAASADLGPRVAGSGPATLRFEGTADARVQRYFDAQLAGSAFGSLTVRVSEIDSGPPRLGMDERYTLTVDAERFELHAPSTWGALRGLATLYQLDQQGGLGTAWKIRDEPRFAWRGLMLDVARHFFPVPVLHDVVDGMALLKLNVLHLHLSDDQAFRFASERFPRLASEEAYAPDELEALVRHAADRGVRIVPELDVPGHVTSWLTGYPEWGFGNGAASRRFGVHKACLHPASGEVDAALTALFAELIEIFPDDYVHVGGDEVHPEHWRSSAELQALMRERGFVDARDLQNHFNEKLFAAIGGLGRKVVAWDEVLHESMPACVVQNWRGATTRDRTLAKGMDCVVSAGYYLDLFYPADVHYRYDPAVPQAQLVALEDGLSEDLRFEHVAKGLAWTEQWRADQVELAVPEGTVLGGEACLWAELVDPPTLPMRLWSRLPAVAERLWSPAEVTDLEAFYGRLTALLQVPEFRWQSHQAQALEHAGVPAEDLETAALLEPVKWYGRLLGETALRARIEGREMPQSRPYDADTPLRRVVDFLAPESLAARAVADADEAGLRARAQAWQALDAGVWPPDTRPAVAALQRIGTALAALLDGRQSADSTRAALLELYGPHGEYMVAVVPWLLEWMSRERSR